MSVVSVSVRERFASAKGGARHPPRLPNRRVDQKSAPIDPVFPNAHMPVPFLHLHARFLLLRRDFFFGEKSARLFIRLASATAARGRLRPIASPPALRRSAPVSVRDAILTRPPNWQFPDPTWDPPRPVYAPIWCICNRAAARAAHRRHRRHLRMLTCPAALPPQITKKRVGASGAWGTNKGTLCCVAGRCTFSTRCIRKDREEFGTLPVNLHESGNALRSWSPVQ